MKSAIHFLVVDFGEGCRSCCCSSCCDRGKTKSTPSPIDLDWNGLGLEFDKSNVCTGNICSCDICPYQEYLSLYWAVFYPTLKVSSWDHLWHICQLSWWHLFKQILSWRHLYISQISNLLVTHIFGNLDFFVTKALRTF